MNKLIYLLFLISTSILAEEMEGHFQVHQYVQSNKSGYTDNLGEKAKFGLDFEVKHKVLFDFTKLMLGADADSTNSGFSRVAGRAGAVIELFSFDVGYYHRSNHNLEYVPTQPMRFISENYIFLRYNFNGYGK